MKYIADCFVTAEHVLCCEDTVLARTSCLHPIVNGCIGQEYLATACIDNPGRSGYLGMARYFNVHTQLPLSK